MHFIIYSTVTTPRLQYILSTLLPAMGVNHFLVTTNLAAFRQSVAHKINYSPQPVDANEFWIAPSNLLFQKNMKPQTIECFKWEGLPVFFKTTSPHIPFDILAASFYLVSRYEEYLPHTYDEYGRYAHTNSLAFSQGFLQMPLINCWLEKWKHALQQFFGDAKFSPRLFNYVPTYDIDMAWSYFGKGYLRNAAGYVRGIIKGQWADIANRTKVLLSYTDDPFDVYQWLDNLHREHSLMPVYFFLMAQKPGRYDKNISPNNKYFKLLLRKICVMYKTGIHPSWQSGDAGYLLLREKNLLVKTVGKPVIDSRLHYVRITLPHTYEALLEAGITNDHSMGYGTINGFRASYCLPHKWYNLATETVTALTIHPFCYMDANSFFEQKLTAQQAGEELQHYYDVVKQVNGTLVTIFHNHLICDTPQQQPWRNMYEQFLQDNF